MVTSYSIVAYCLKGGVFGRSSKQMNIRFSRSKSVVLRECWYDSKKVDLLPNVLHIVAVLVLLVLTNYYIGTEKVLESRGSTYYTSSSSGFFSPFIIIKISRMKSDTFTSNPDKVFFEIFIDS